MQATQLDVALAKTDEAVKQRRFTRYVIRNRPHAGFISGGVRVVGQVRNITQAGLFLLTTDYVAVGNLGKVGVEFPNWFFRANAFVRSVQPGHGFGLEFISMSSVDRRALRAYSGALRRSAAKSKSGLSARPGRIY